MYKVSVNGVKTKLVLQALVKRGVDAQQEGEVILSQSEGDAIHRALRNYRDNRVSMGYAKFHWTVTRNA